MKKMSCRESTTCGAMNKKKLMLLMFAVGMMTTTMMTTRVGGEPVSAGKMNHVVGDDRGWDAASDIASWSSQRLFLAGDDIWFAFSAAEEMVAELSSKDEFEACNVSNPIRTYADGLNVIRLESQGHRYFTSSNVESCRNGLKLHVDVLPRHHRQQPQWESALGDDAHPPKPSPSSLLIPSSFWVFWTAIACFFFLIHHHY